MNTRAPEKEILRIYPHMYKTTATLTGLALVILSFLVVKDFDFSNLRISDHIQLVVFLSVFVFSLFPRVIVTTHRISYTYGPFFKQEIERSKINDIYISPHPNYLRLTQRDTIWTKPLFGKAKHPYTAEYWYKHGLLNFNHAENQKSFKLISLKKLGLAEFSKAQTDQLLDILKQNWNFNTTRVELSPVDAPVDDITTQDIGKTVVVLIFISILIGFIGFLLPIGMFTGLHFAVESYLWLIPFIILAIALSYELIKRENKHHAFVSSILVGIFLGASLYFLTLQLNRSYSELHANTMIEQLTFSRTVNNAQVWSLPETLRRETGLNEIYIHQSWQGYNTQAKLGKTYDIEIRKGLFNDYFVDDNSFKNVRHQSSNQ